MSVYTVDPTAQIWAVFSFGYVLDRKDHPDLANIGCSGIPPSASLLLASFF
jgi:hypothetical protein